MADYNLHGLNTRDFQHLIQAIARKRIASGVTAFGDGKDGARDLTFSGKMDYPSASNPWDGYLILGCKFSQRANRDSSKDGQWARQQLKIDMDKFLSKKRKLTRPEYYIFATNIALSGVDKSGGHDQLVSMLEDYKLKLGMKDYAIWDYNDIRGFIDGDHDIRTAYGHFITAGDVLARMMELVSLKSTNFSEIMHIFLQKELIGDMSAKLQSPGEDPELQIPLANVFVDLPCVKSAEEAALGTQSRQHGSEKLPMATALLLQAGSAVLRRTQQQLQPAVNDCSDEILPNRFVIVGGPGQGKSTIGQYLCQLYRAAILKDRPAETIDVRVTSILKQLEMQRKPMGGFPIVRRFPLRIELRNFSHALSNEPHLTLLEYVRRDIARLSNSSLNLDDIYSWLAKYPWLLMLDGLDEVPPTSNRAEVLRQIEDFQIDAASRNSDLFIIATTRPQSYSQEFSEKLFRHLYLTPLSPSQALGYGSKLAEARCGGDERRRDELVRSLEKACKNEATARLMQSPLQVTIMATLLEDTGEPPQQRYRLFLEYYRTIYKRETRRKLLGGILSERQTDIDYIHAHVGLMLHAASEIVPKPGRTEKREDVDSALSDEQFRQIVRLRLDKIGIPQVRATELLDRISDGSLQRLVFLVRPREGWVRFDITSLKEFMAAEAIMTGSDEDVRNRLNVIGPASYWRNVFQFAVGKCFVERDYLLDTLVSLCAGLNEEKSATQLMGDKLAGQAAKSVLWGSQLALDILVDGTARQYPGYELRFARIALQLLKLGDVRHAAGLASVFHDDLRSLYEEEIKERLANSIFSQQMGGWLLLMALSERDIRWAIDAIETNWPSDLNNLLRILTYTRSYGNTPKIAAGKYVSLIPRIHPILFRNFVQHRYWSMHDNVIGEPWQSVLEYLISQKKHLLINNRSEWNSIAPKLTLLPIQYGKELLDTVNTLKFYNDEWNPLVASVRFANAPSARKLAEELRWLAEVWASRDDSPSLKLSSVPMPWPLAVCMERAKSSEELKTIAKSAEDGELGDIKDWHMAEQRWHHQGLTEADFLYTPGSSRPIDLEWVRKGFPFSITSIAPDSALLDRKASDLVEKLSNLPPTPGRAFLAGVLLKAWDRHPSAFNSERISLTMNQIYTLTNLAPLGRSNGVWLDYFFRQTASAPLGKDSIADLDWLGRRRVWIGVETPRPDEAEEIQHHFCADPEARKGLVHILSALGISGCQISLPRSIVNATKSWDSESRTAVLALAAGRGQLGDAEILELISELSLSKSQYAIWRALRQASTASIDQAARLALNVLEVIEDLTEDQARTRDHAYQILTEFLQGRPSALREHAVWTKLKLPDSI